jgi:hypothetical protein
MPKLMYGKTILTTFTYEVDTLYTQVEKVANLYNCIFVFT